jgi:hypothetical protein
MKTLTRDEQRRREARNVMLSARLELHLRDLVCRALGGDREAAAAFQQMSQFAPPEMKARMLDYVSTR